MNRKTFLILVCVFVTMTACKSTQNKHLGVKAMSTKKILKAHEHKDFSKNTIQAKLKVHYEDSRNSQNLAVKLRIQKDQVIWMSGSFLGFPVAKVKITPTSVQYYEKINNTYFDGDFSLINNALGTDLNFKQLQNILLGQMVFEPKNTKFEKEIDRQAYLLYPKNESNLLSVFYWINPKIFKLNQQKITSLQNNRSFVVSYPEYHHMSGEYFPKKMAMQSHTLQGVTKINMVARAVELNKKLTFPFVIPKGYKEISINDL